MVYQIIDLLLNVAVTIVAGSCLLLCYMDFFRIQPARIHATFGTQITSFLLLATNWLTLPLRKLIQNTGKVNIVYLVSGYLVVVAKVVVLALFSHRLMSDIALLFLPIVLSALIEYIELFLSIFSGITFVFVVLSWLGPMSPSYAIASSILEPLLSVIRKRIPSTGMIDLTPLALLLIIKILQIVVSNLH